MILPLLDYSNRKGNNGRIGVIGGSDSYTGAPYFAATASLLLGSDLVSIITTPSASIPIKAYSPDLIVHPILLLPTLAYPIIDRFHALIVGPGLGRDEQIMQKTLVLIQYAISRNILIVFDADALWLLNSNLSLIKGYSKAILTPNRAEYDRMIATCELAQLSEGEAILQFARMLDGPIVVRKGRTDLVTNGDLVLESNAAVGCPKRCGGQGDILVGVIATLTMWEFSLEAVLSGCDFVRAVAQESFKDKGRSMQASDLLVNMPRVAKSFFKNF